MALEMVNVFSFITQLLVISGFFFLLSPGFAGLNLLLVLIVLEVFGRLFRKQQIIQRGFVDAKRNKEIVAPADRLGSRIQTAEFGTLLASMLVVLMNFISNVWLAAPFLILMGALGGFLVVPMNALLQHRGHNLMGAGRSIAVQNFNEQACILGLGALYALSTGVGMSAFGAITGFGLIEDL